MSASGNSIASFAGMAVSLKVLTELGKVILGSFQRPKVRLFLLASGGARMVPRNCVLSERY